MSAPPAAQDPLVHVVGPTQQQEEEAHTATPAIQGPQDIQGSTPASDTDTDTQPEPPADFEAEPAEAEVEDEDEAGSSQAEEEVDEGSYYWDASTMAPLNPASAAAVARLRAYKPPPFPLWDRLPVSRRAAVLLLLYADRRGDLRVVITMRAASLRSFSGHAALPGGKADTLEETAYHIARREAWEEIGLPLDDSKLPAPFTIEHLCYLPMSLARTELVVRPCVAFLHTVKDVGAPVGSSSPTVEESLIPRLDAKEVAAVFSAPFHNFLKIADERPSHSTSASTSWTPPPGNWYEGSWTTWHDTQWRMHFFYVPVTTQRVVKPKVREGGLAALSEHVGENGAAAAAAEEDDIGEGGRYKVWGMTARILVDAATIAYGEQPEFEANRHFGDEKLIETLAGMGRMEEKKRHGSALTAEEIKKAKEALRESGGKSVGKNGEASKM
ncbi:hypothetical protein C8A05DRAFT_42582 [Staphylotrichum tortipilum]|uniref:Nudix hydrolase domain-containing protein n=1 Tax=Staphylotrichum tortipilum TaxID=2831512 RepID=A0AAN6RW50_9PEZI|nr:hypothetical protein C8A05DRAFT_42582 [Staphylotrichum longicolle]